MPVVRAADRPLVSMFDGKVRRRTMVWGDAMLVAEIHFDPGGVVPEHQHVYEQIGYCISGRFELAIDGRAHAIEPGMSWAVPSNVPHAARALTPCFLLEIWHPARGDYQD
ncbi:MAG: cupin domain-containing protein [Actinobacteria bacterium]|nr:cupin domain-containing protein [Actinomycetota bacterium]